MNTPPRPEPQRTHYRSGTSIAPRGASHGSGCRYVARAVVARDGGHRNAEELEGRIEDEDDPDTVQHSFEDGRAADPSAMDEKVLELQNAKRDLADAIVGGNKEKI